MRCPKCGNHYCAVSANVQISGKDYSVGWGLVGTALFDGYGAALGWQDKRRTDVQAYWVCKKCGCTFPA